MRDGWRQVAPIPLRLVLGFGFAYHGFPKLFTTAGHESFAGMLQGLGVPAPGLSAWAIGGFEFFGGLALIAGAFTTLVSMLGIVEMVFAAIMVHLPYGFNFLNITGQTQSGPTFGMPGYEVNFLYIGGFMTLLLAGAGGLSVDALRRREAGEQLTGRLPVEPAGASVPDRAWTGEGVGDRAWTGATAKFEEPAGRGANRHA